MKITIHSDELQSLGLWLQISTEKILVTIKQCFGSNAYLYH